MNRVVFVMPIEIVFDSGVVMMNFVRPIELSHPLIPGMQIKTCSRECSWEQYGPLRLKAENLYLNELGTLFAHIDARDDSDDESVAEMKRESVFDWDSLAYWAECGWFPACMLETRDGEVNLASFSPYEVFAMSYEKISSECSDLLGYHFSNTVLLDENRKQSRWADLSKWLLGSRAVQDGRWALNPFDSYF